MKYGKAELKVAVNANPNDISIAVMTAKATTFGKLKDSLDQPSTAGKILSHSRSYLRLGSKKMYANHNINCILLIDSPDRV
jgi:hypothetical protein